MKVSSIRYQPIEGGALGGHFALHVTLGAGDSPGVIFSATELATHIHDDFEKLSLKAKAIRGVLIDCRAATHDVDEMNALLGTLKDWGHQIILWVNEDIRHPWFEFANYITVFVRSRNWANFRVTEIRYEPPSEGPWEEPEVFDVNQNAASYVVAGAQSASIILKFVTEAKRPWGIVQRAKVAAAIGFELKE